MPAFTSFLPTPAAAEILLLIALAFAFLVHYGTMGVMYVKSEHNDIKWLKAATIVMILSGIALGMLYGFKAAAAAGL